jgi:homogentisate 1,2-dioxygenase
MPHYIKRGEIPNKRHTQFRKPDGGLYAEQLFSTEGFSNDYSLLYHTYAPTLIVKCDDPIDVNPVIAEEKMLKHRSFEGFNVKPEQDFLQSRKAVLVNKDCHIVLASPTTSMTDYFYKNADADEMLFIHEGSGVLKTAYGQIAFGYGDYLMIPRGTIYQIHFDTPNNRMFIVESFRPIRYPKRYLSDYGQLMEHSPFCERDFKLPTDFETHDEQGDFKIMITVSLSPLLF